MPDQILLHQSGHGDAWLDCKGMPPKQNGAAFANPRRAINSRWLLTLQARSQCADRAVDACQSRLRSDRCHKGGTFALHARVTCAVFEKGGVATRAATFHNQPNPRQTIVSCARANTNDLRPVSTTKNAA